MRSPTCVSQLFLTVTDAPLKPIHLNDSWSDDIPSSSSSSLLYKTEEESLQVRFQRVKERLQKLQQEQGNVKKEFKMKLQTAKNECKEQLFKKYSPFLRNNSTTKKEDVIISDSTKMISFLREENKQLREQMTVLQVSMKELRQQNKSLEIANAQAEQARIELQGHVNTLQSVHDKLTRSIQTYKQHLEIAKMEYKTRNTHYLAEAHSRAAYERGILQIMSHMGRQQQKQQRCRYHITLVQDIKMLTMQAEQMEQSERTSILEQYGIESPLPEVRGAPRKSLTGKVDGIENRTIPMSHSRRAITIRDNNDSDDEED